MQHVASRFAQVELIRRVVHHTHDLVLRHPAVLGEDVRLAHGGGHVDVFAGHAHEDPVDAPLGFRLGRLNRRLEGGQKAGRVVPLAARIARVGHGARAHDLAARKAAALRNQRDDLGGSEFNRRRNCLH